MYLNLNYNHLGNLVEQSWFIHLWHLCHMFSSPIRFKSIYEVHLTREKDKQIIDVFREMGICQLEHLLTFQCLRRYKKV